MKKWIGLFFVVLLLLGAGTFVWLKIARNQNFSESVEKDAKLQLQELLQKEKPTVQKEILDSTAFFVERVSKENNVWIFWVIETFHAQIDKQLVKDCLKVYKKQPKWALELEYRTAHPVKKAERKAILQQFEAAIPIPFQLDMLGDSKLLLRLPPVSPRVLKRVKSSTSVDAGFSLRLVASQKVGGISSSQEVKNYKETGNKERLEELRLKGFRYLSGPEGDYLVWQDDKYDLTHRDIEKVYRDVSNMTWNFDLYEDGAEKLKELTTNYKREKLAVILLDKVLMAPTIQDTIPNGSVVLMGVSEETMSQLRKIIMMDKDKDYHTSLLKEYQIQGDYPDFGNVTQWTITYQEITPSQIQQLKTIGGYLHQISLQKYFLRIAENTPQVEKKIQTIIPQANVTQEQISQLK